MKKSLKKHGFLKYLWTIILTTIGINAFNTTSILNVSYDATRELYKEYNMVFIKYWKEKTGQDIIIKQSHGASSKQARAVIDGLNADVVTLALAHEIDDISTKTKLIPKNWRTGFPYNSSPYTSTIIFLVRKGNPKGIKDWNDLIKPGISVITANPKTSGGACWNYLAAWGYALFKSEKNPEYAKEFINKLYKNVTVLDTSGRRATTTFVERGIGDVLINWENEILLCGYELWPDKFDMVIPSISIITEPIVSIVNGNTNKNGTLKEAKAYLEYLYSEEGQEIIAKHHFRPNIDKVKQKYSSKFVPIKLFTLAEITGDWNTTYKEHFAEGGVFDQIYKS